MKFLGSQFAYFLREREVRANVGALLKYLAFLAAVILLNTVIFHFLMAHEGQQHSWISGLYWTLVVMSTLGFGDIIFESDPGRLFSVYVLLSGVVLLLVALPFVFIQNFLAPWLEARVRFRAPREVPKHMTGHVIITQMDSITPGLIARLRLNRIPHYVLEGDPATAARLVQEGLPVVFGDAEAKETFVALRAENARLIFVNGEDAPNTNVTLTVRQIAPAVPIAALATNADSIDVLELAGVDHVLPLRRQLGEQLANRVNAGHARVHIVGRFHDLLIGEFPVHNTPLTGRTIRETRLREVVGVSIVGVWEGGRLHPATPDRRLTDSSVPVLVATREQIEKLDELLVIYDTNYNPVLIIGGGKVGRAAGRMLRKQGLEVHIIEKKPEMRGRAETAADAVFIGDAADRNILMQAGFADTPSVLLTTHDDAMNIYLAVYCRRLNPAVRLVSRITHERNVEAVVRAGADFVLSFASLGMQSVMSILHGNDLMVLGEGMDLFRVAVPVELGGLSLAESRIGERTGLTVVAVQQDGEIVTALGPDFRLRAGSEMLTIGSHEQREKLARLAGGR
jgi:voltage-gated potassium channel